MRSWGWLKVAMRMRLKRLTRRPLWKCIRTRTDIPRQRKPSRKLIRLSCVWATLINVLFMMKEARKRITGSSISRGIINRHMMMILTLMTYLTCSLAEVSINRELDIIISRHRGDRGRGIKNKIILRLSFFNWGPYFWFCLLVWY